MSATLLPSGRYRALLEPSRYGRIGDPTLVIEQLVPRTGEWSRCPSGWYADTLVNGDRWSPGVTDGSRLALDYGAGWFLDVNDTSALLELARSAL